jgi:hypothetical protein
MVQRPSGRCSEFIAGTAAPAATPPSAIAGAPAPSTSRARSAARPSAGQVDRERPDRRLPSRAIGFGHVGRNGCALDARRREAVDAILRRWPETHRFEPHSHEAPRLLIGPDASLDLRIDDRDSITITRWSGLSLDVVMRVLVAAFGEKVAAVDPCADRRLSEPLWRGRP